MELAEIRKSLNSPLRQATLCLLVKEGAVLLAMKKRGFGAGRWNGVGGKPQPGETIEQAAIRETREEIGVVPITFRKAGTLNFYFPHNADWNQRVCVYLVEEWEGEPTESKEMSPQWFRHEEIPFHSMWPGDIHWLPKVLKGVLIEGHFLFGENDKILDFEIRENLESEVEQNLS